MNRDLGVDLPRQSSDNAPIQDRDVSFAEKRRHRRRQLAIRCWMADGVNTVYARLHDVSMGGLSVRAPVPFSPDTELELALVVSAPDLGELGDPNGIVSVRARGRVVWVRSREGGPRMGAEFMSIEIGKSTLFSLID